MTVSDFNKNTFVSIREYYVTDAGETKPGKKVSLFLIYQCLVCEIAVLTELGHLSFH